MKLDSSAFVADQELLTALQKLTTPFVCSEDHVLFAQGEPSTGLYILHSGTGLLTMTSNDGEPIFHTPLSPGMLLGLPGAIGNQPYSLNAIVFQGAEVSYVSREDFAQLMLREPALSLHVLRVLAAEVRTARSALSQA
ncbi:MAG TPA: Crp/Fnr family transcriptional regulator [Terracidiphilus sp.]|jgi:CRP-like cAMP-binding protein|nr:Crp/Fnr family transcriptional regulator [Terracidiphilus sp.]